MDLHEQGASSRTFAIAAIVCVLLQAGLAPQISIAGGRVNFMIILVCLSVFSGDPTRAVVCGFCSGLFYDLSAAVPVGVMSLLLTVGSFALVFILLVIGATMTVGLCLLPTSFEIISTGRLPPCSEPITGFKFA
mgnify:CR=1 FL=1